MLRSCILEQDTLPCNYIRKLTSGTGLHYLLASFDAPKQKFKVEEKNDICNNNSNYTGLHNYRIIIQTQPKTDIIAEKNWQLFLVQKNYFIAILCKKVFSFYQVKSLTLLCGETFAALPPWLRVTPDSQPC